MTKSQSRAGWAKGSRTLHRWVVPLCAIPLLITISTGILLLIKAQIPAIQPEALSGQSKAPTLSFDRVLEISKSVPEAEVRSWKDIPVIDIRPTKGVIRVRTKNNHEIQIDAESGQVLGHAPRYTTLLISIHEGSWFGGAIKNFIFLPAGILLLTLWVTGLVIFIHPYLRKLKSPRIAAPQRAQDLL